MAEALVEAGGWTPRQAAAALRAHLEEGIAAFLGFRGVWTFEPAASPEAERIESAPLERVLVDLLPGRGLAVELASPLGGLESRLSCGSEASQVVSSPDTRLVVWLDGARSLTAAASLARMHLDRAAAVALVLVAFGHAEVLEPAEQRRGDAAAAPPPSEDPEGTATPVHLRSFVTRVRTSDYFALLGVGPDDDAAAVARAHGALRARLGATVPDEPDLVALQREVLRSLDEARDVLSEPALRRAYSLRLKPPSE